MKTRAMKSILALTLLTLTAAFAPAPSTALAGEVDLSLVQRGDVVLRGESGPDGCVYPTLLASQPAGRATLLRANADCEIYVAETSSCHELTCVACPDCVVIDCPTCTELLGETPLPSAGVHAGPCFGCVELDPCFECPPSEGPVADESIEVNPEQEETHCVARTLNSRISSGTDEVRASINYRYHCRSGTSWSWASSSCAVTASNWRLRWCSHGGVYNAGSYVTKSVAGGFDHRHSWGYDAYHEEGTSVTGYNSGATACSYWWTWNPHTNMVATSCW